MKKRTFIDRIKLLWKLLKGCRRPDCVIGTPETDNLLSSKTFFSTMTDLEIARHLPGLLDGLDPESTETVIRYLTLLSCCMRFHDNLILNCKNPNFSPEDFQAMKQEIARKTKLPERFIFPEVFYFHMGFSYMPAKAAEYVRNKVFIDCGTFIGDSVLAMLDYSPSKVIAIDVSPQAAELFYKTLKDNSVEDKAELILSGISDQKESFMFEDDIEKGTSLNNSGDTPVSSDTLDNLCAKYADIGFIKADIEGFGYKMAAGMTEILKRDRPVLSLAIYHNTEEFFKIKPFLESLSLDYRFKIVPSTLHYGGEIYLLAYPQELDAV